MSFAIYILIGIFLTPYIITKIGSQGYGVWLFIVSFAGHYGLLTVGISSAVSHYIAIELGKKNLDRLNFIFSTSLSIYTAIALIIVALSVILSGPVQDYFNIDSINFKHAFVIFSVSSGLTIVNSIFQALLTAHEKFVLNNLISLIVTVIRTITTVLFLALGHEVIGLAYSFLLAGIIHLLINVVVHSKIFSTISYSLRYFEKSSVKMLVAYGASTFIISIGDLLRFNIDNLVITYWIDVSAVAIYGIAVSLINYIVNIIVSVINVISPRFSKLVGSGQQDQLNDLFNKSMFISSLLSFGALVMVVYFGKDVIYYWVGEKFDQSFVILVIMAITFTISLAQFPALSIIYSLNKHKYFGYFTLGEGVINLILSIVLVQKLGVMGAALGTLVAASLVKIIVQPLYMKRLINISLRKYLTPVVAPFCIALFLIFLRLHFFKFDVKLSQTLPSMLGLMLFVGSLYLFFNFIFLTIIKSPYRTLMFKDLASYFYQLKYHLQLAVDYLRNIRQSGSKKLIYAGGFPTSENLGDVALYRAYQKIFKDYDLVHYSEGWFNKIITKMFKLDAKAVLGGGTLINDMCLKEAQESSTLFSDFFVFGTGVAQPSFFARIETWKDSMVHWKKVLNRAKYVGVRGPLSQKLLLEHGIPCEIIWDPVLIFSNVRNVSNQEFEEKTIGINVGGSDGRLWGSEDVVRDKFVSLAKILKQNGFKIRWFVVVAKDLSMTRKIAKESGTEDCIIPIYFDIVEYFNQVRKVAVFVGVKLHSVIMAHCEYVPSIMIEYRPKCQDYMLSVEQGHINFRSDQIEVEKIYQEILKLHENRKSESDNLYNLISRIRQKQEQKARDLV